MNWVDVVAMTEQDALSRVEEARRALASALEVLRVVRGESATEECRYCEGSGMDPLKGLIKDADETCWECSGSGQQRKPFPLVVTKIKYGGQALQPSLFKSGVTWVRVRPCDPECGGKTYLGWLLGEIAMGQSARMDADGTLNVSMSLHNPAIFVPDLERVVYGCGSWWAAIKTVDDLRKISDADIENVWYMKALKSIEEGGNEDAS